MIAIIPARGGSKRIPRKNIRLFNGIPVISYAIKNALESGLFEEVMVSTDDEEIAKIALKYGAKVPFYRSVETSNDFASTVDVIQEVISMYKLEGKSFDKACCIYPCAPFVTSELLNIGYNKLVSGDFDSIFPVIRYSTPIQRALKIQGNNVVMFNPEFALTRSQDLEPAYYDAGMFYWFHIDTILKKGGIMTNKSSFIEMNEMETQDIDNETDWEIAEFKYSLIHSKKVK